MCLDTKDNVFSPLESSDFLMLLFKCNNVLQAETLELFLLNLLLIFVQHLCEQECIPVGCVLSAAVAIGGVSAPVHAGICLPRGVSAPVHAGICLSRGVSAPVHAGLCLPGGVCPSTCLDTHLPPVNRMTDRQV